MADAKFSRRIWFYPKFRFSSRNGSFPGNCVPDWMASEKATSGNDEIHVSHSSKGSNLEGQRICFRRALGAMGTTLDASASDYVIPTDGDFSLGSVVDHSVFCDYVGNFYVAGF